jgi:hypothetical protein
MSVDQYSKLCKNVFNVSQSIRFAGVITKMGRLIVGGRRQNLESMEDKNNSSKLYVQFALRTEMRKRLCRSSNLQFYRKRED